ncbi:hypothetical protein VB618_07485 [Microvirga sp. CF3062]|uniref:hypothetical protein n=1 Tax=Microvirga sp. CF3062 TaxID=3110182 RepID=UPI002E7685B6|nr:hypothetical protein [Microvirga sp. CF3062]MEE1656034.1 hypothetical protein [Microvirga sp. CF3062]
MKIGWPLVTKSALLTLLMAVGPMAAAQTGRPWVDPPAGGATAPSPAPQPPAPEPVRPAPPAASPQAASPAPATPPTQAAQPQTPIVRPDVPATRQAQQPEAVPSAPSPATPPPATTAQPRQDPAGEKREARAATAKRFAVDYLTSWSAPNDSALESTAAFYAPRVLFHGREVTMKRLFDEKRRFVRRWPARDYRPREDGVGTVCNPAGEICTVHAVFDFTASHPRRRRASQGTGALQLVVHFIGDRPVIVAEHSTLLGQERKRNLALEGASND